MCGIAGAVWNDPQAALDEATLIRMTRVLAHRGPDDEQFFAREWKQQPVYGTQPGVALGFRRLAVIDRESGRQPMSNEDGSIWVVFNGEIYNYPELRFRLEGSGHTLRTASDTETLVHLYEDEGPHFVEHLVGMFALALWDGNRGRLILARDRLGKKPLVYRQEGSRLLFASEIKSLLEAPGVPREIDPAALDAYLTYQYIPPPRTIFSGIHKLPPAHVAIYERGGLTLESYWSPKYAAESELTYQEASQQLERSLAEAVRCRLHSDVPLGAFLSGGVDSSIIVALMQAASSQRVKTFSIGFPQAQFDESRYAREVAKHLGTEHHEFRVEPHAADVLPQIIEAFDEPFADSSALPTWWLARETKSHVTVALTGDGGDELFAGYPRYAALECAGYFDQLPKPLRSLATLSAWQSLPHSGSQRSVVRRFQRLSAALAGPAGDRYLRLMEIFGEQRRAALYSDEFILALPEVDPGDELRQALALGRTRDPITAATIADLVTYLPGDLFVKVDRASMAHGLECRSPFVDHRVVELALSFPIEWKRRWGRGKRMLRDLYASKLPKSVFHRPKQGFGVPLAEWFRGELKDFLREILFDARTTARGYFRSETISELVGEHLDRRFDHSARLWALVVFELWHRRWMK